MSLRKMLFAAAGIGALHAAGLTVPASAQDADVQQSDGAVTSLDAVTSTATRSETSALEAPASISVVDREAIELSQPQSLDDVLKGVPGIQMTGGPRNTAEQPNIRGFDDDRVVIVTDGVRKNFQSGHRGRTFVDPSLLRQVDVLRGPSSMLYGSGALGGVIKMETVDAADMLKPGQTVGARTSLGYQTGNDMRRGAQTIYGAPVDGVDVLVHGTRSESGNYKDGAGDKIPYSADDIRSGLGKVSLFDDGHDLDLSVQSFRDVHEIPTAANTNGTVIADRTTLENSASAAYSYDDIDDLFDLKATAYYSDTRIREFVTASGRHDLTELDTVGLDAANSSLFVLGEDADVRVTGGFELYKDRQEGQRKGAPRAQYPTASQLTQGYFAQAEFTLWEDLTVTPGLRFDTYDQEAAGQQDVSDSKLSKKLAVSYQATDWLMVFGSYSEAFRAPSLTELYVSGTHFVFNTFVPNPDLRPEFAKNKEIGAALSFDGVAVERDALRIKGAVFRNDVEDLIEQNVTGGIFGNTTTSNVPEARITGAELEVAYDSRDYFVTLAGTRLRGDDLTADEPLADIPEDLVTLGFGMRLLDTGLAAGWRSALYFGQDRVPAGTDTVPGKKVIHDLYVSYEPNDPMLDGMRLDFGIDNVFDKDYQRFGSVLRETGRNVKLTGTYRF